MALEEFPENTGRIQGDGYSVRGRRRFLTGLALVFLILLAVSLVQAWPHLPETLPMQFAPDGSPARSGSRTELLIMTGVLFLVTLPLLAGGWWVEWMRRHPRWVNIPRKKEILSLPPERQAPYWELTAEFMAALGAAMSLLFLLLFRGMLAVALGGRNTLPAWSLWPGLGGVLLVLLVYLPRLVMMPRRLTARRNHSGRPAP